MSNNRALLLTYRQSLRLGWFLFTRIVPVYVPFWVFYDAAPYNSGFGWIARVLAGLLPPLPLLWWVSPKLFERQFGSFTVQCNTKINLAKLRWLMAWGLYWRALVLTAGLDGILSVAFVTMWVIGSGQPPSGGTIQEASRAVAGTLTAGIYPLGIAFFGVPLALRWLFSEFQLSIVGEVEQHAGCVTHAPKEFQPDSMSGIGRCPSCNMRVRATAEGTCPSCHAFFADATGEQEATSF